MVKVAISSCGGGSASGSQSTGQYSCSLDPNGWAWLVTGRKLYVWRHTPESGRKSAISCRELVLPPSELVHHAKLVAVLGTSMSTAPACLAISPEGHITYWPNISNESNTVTVNADIPVSIRLLLVDHLGFQTPVLCFWNFLGTRMWFTHIDLALRMRRDYNNVNNFACEDVQWEGK